MDRILFGAMALIIIIAAVLLYRRVTGEFIPAGEKSEELTSKQPDTIGPISDNPPTKICPWCKAEIPADAAYCRY